jgi:hypothetical protein
VLDALDAFGGLDECEDEPQAASASAHSTGAIAGRRRGRRVMLWLSLMRFAGYAPTGCRPGGPHRGASRWHRPARRSVPGATLIPR